MAAAPSPRGPVSGNHTHKVAGNAATTPAHDTLKTLGFEVLFAGILIVIAGTSDNAGKMVAWFAGGLWLVFMVAHPEVFTRINDSVNGVMKGTVTK